MLPHRVLLFALLLFGTASWSQGGEPCAADGTRMIVRIGGRGSASHGLTYDSVDHAPFDDLLRRFVDCRGRVGYGEWKSDADASARLTAYLSGLGQVDTSAPASAAGKLAYFINAYNALAIWGILRDYPTASIQLLNRKSACYRIFDDLELWVGDRYLSLNQIENEMLRPLKEPRIHFALVCAAKGCPRLRNEAYAADRIDRQLADNAADFFADRRRFRVCRVTGTVWLSPILTWYGKDFGPDDHAVLGAVLAHLPAADRQWTVEHPCCKVKHLGYDWSLNDRCPPLSARMGGTGYALYAAGEPLLRPVIKVFSSRHRQD